MLTSVLLSGLNGHHLIGNAPHLQDKIQKDLKSNSVFPKPSRDGIVSL